LNPGASAQFGNAMLRIKVQCRSDLSYMAATSIAVKFMTDVARLRVLGVGFAEKQPV